MDSDLEASDDSAEPGRREEEAKEMNREWNARKQGFWNVGMACAARADLQHHVISCIGVREDSNSEIWIVREYILQAGYREGMDAGKVQTVQEGFDEGFRQGAAEGRAKGRQKGLQQTAQAKLPHVEQA